MHIPQCSTKTSLLLVLLQFTTVFDTCLCQTRACLSHIETLCHPEVYTWLHHLWRGNSCVQESLPKITFNMGESVSSGMVCEIMALLAADRLQLGIGAMQVT